MIANPLLTSDGRGMPRLVLGWLSFALVAGLMAIATLAVARRFEALRERS